MDSIFHEIDFYLPSPECSSDEKETKISNSGGDPSKNI